MKKLTKLQSAIFAIGAVMLVAGAVLYLFEPKILAPSLYGVGAVCYVSMQWLQSYEGRNLTMKRLRKIQVVSGVFLLFSAILMVLNRFVYEIFTFYRVDIYNYWIIFLFIGVILQLYTILRMDKEIKID